MFQVGIHTIYYHILVIGDHLATIGGVQFQVLHLGHFWGVDLTNLIKPSVCNEHSFQYYGNIKKRTFSSFGYINGIAIVSAKLAFMTKTLKENPL